jgi:hypothetical protein
MIDDPQLVPRDALRERRVAISVSESSDLARLGLHPLHLDLTIAELTRAIVLAGGIVVYGGRIDVGFTRIVREEAERYASDHVVFEHYVPYTEHAEVSQDDLQAYADRLGVHSAVYLVDAAGNPASVSRASRPDFARASVEQAAGLTTARTLLASVCDSRVIVGGRLSGYAGTMPGVVEEAVLTLERGKPLYVAGGFGGAAAFVGRHQAPDLYQWLPEGMPQNVDFIADNSVLDVLRGTSGAQELDSDEALRLASSNRPSDIATLTILGLSRLASR